MLEVCWYSFRMQMTKCIKELPLSFLPHTCSLTMCVSVHTHTLAQSLKEKFKRSFEGLFSSRTSLSVRVLQPRSHVPFFGPSPELNTIKWVFSFTGNRPMGGFPSAFQFKKIETWLVLSWRLPSCLQWPGSEAGWGLPLSGSWSCA